MSVTIDDIADEVTTRRDYGGGITRKQYAAIGRAINVGRLASNSVRL